VLSQFANGAVMPRNVVRPPQTGAAIGSAPAAKDTELTQLLRWR